MTFPRPGPRTAGRSRLAPIAAVARASSWSTPRREPICGNSRARAAPTPHRLGGRTFASCVSVPPRRGRGSRGKMEGKMDLSARAIRRLAVLCIGALLAGQLAGCVSVSEYRKLEHDVRTLQAKQSGTGGREQVADLGARMDSLQADLQRLEGRLEVVEHNTQDALNEAHKARREANDPAAPPQASPPAGSPEPPPLGTTARPGSPQVAAAAPSPAPSPPGTAPAPADDGASKKGASAEEVQAYRAAFAAWQRNDTDACI